jgi:lysophospholipase L1-like esterase
MGSSRRKHMTQKVETTFVMFLICWASYGQDSLYTFYTSNNFVSDSFNVIQNRSVLDAFYENLYQQKLNNDRKISIIHLGDSHIQADFLTAITRKRMQKSFGNAGRGLIVPFRVAGTNEPLNIQTSSTVTWSSKRCVFPDQPLPIGIGGITIQTADPESRLYFYMNDPLEDYRFNKVTFFHEGDSSSFQLVVKDLNYREIGISTKNVDESMTTDFRLPELADGLVVETLRSNETQSQCLLFGINVENGKNGIVYHSIGVNGAKFSHYNQAKYFVSQTSDLQPALFIISLGTNESIEYPYINKNFEQQVDLLITSLQAQNPYARFLFSTPQENLQKDKSNPGVKLIRTMLIKYATENGHAFWDWYQVTGGADSTLKWKTSGFLRADGVHLSKEGYELQGNLLYHALMKGYQEYVSYRHP